jgi:hypothetical protein
MRFRILENRIEKIDPTDDVLIYKVLDINFEIIEVETVGEYDSILDRDAIEIQSVVFQTPNGVVTLNNVYSENQKHFQNKAVVIQGTKTEIKLIHQLWLCENNVFEIVQ